MIRKYTEIFCWKNVSSFCTAKATHIFSAKNIRILCIESAKTVNEMTLNELVKLTTLWTTGPRYFLSSFDSTGLGSAEEVQNRFSKGHPWRPTWISHWNDFSYFWFYQVLSQLAFQFRIGSKQIFKIAAMVAILDSCLKSFSQFWSTLILPTKFQSVGPSVQEKKFEKRF